MSEVRYVLVPGGGSDSWHWHRVVPLLQARGHEAVAVDLPCADPAAGLEEYADATIAAIGDHPSVVVVAHSMGALHAPIACARRPVDLLVLVAPMVPRPGESGSDWWGAVGQHEAAAELAAAQGRSAEFDPEALFWHDVPADVAAAGHEHELEESSRAYGQPSPLTGWPDVPTRVVACREDRLLPLDLVRRCTRDRLGIAPDEMSGGHQPALAHPEELVDLLEWLRWQEAPGRRRGRLGSGRTGTRPPVGAGATTTVEARR